MEMSDIMYVRLAIGLADFSRCGVRYKMLINDYAAKSPTDRKLPLNVDLVNWAHKQSEDQLDPTATKEIWAALVSSFFLCVRTSEMRNLRHFDAILVAKDNADAITIFFRKEKRAKWRRRVFDNGLKHSPFYVRWRL